MVSICSFSQTTKKQDSATVKKDTIKLKYNFKHNQNGSLFLKDPTKLTVVYDKTLNKYVFAEKIGDYYVGTPVFMTPKEYKKHRLKNDMLAYFKQKVTANNSNRKGAKKAQKNLLPMYYVNSDFFESLFGGNTIEVIPTGNINLKTGFIYQKTDNPQLSENNRSSFTFDFDQQISASIQAKVGKRLKLTANYDTQSTLDFQNLIKLEYTPTEDDIIQEIDAGNVAMPIKNSLINGAQSLFGVKTRLKFGNTNITAVFSQQNSESKVITAKGGASVQPFELRATDYDNDRHFFLSHYFRENYANSLQNYPLVSSPINITRVEVWVTNRNATTEDFRSIVALADIGEGKQTNLVDNTNTVTVNNNPSINGKVLPANAANNLNNLLTINGGIRDINTVKSTLESQFSMKEGTDYSYLQNARRLQPNEYTLHSQLGYISLNRRLDDGEVLAVAFEYTVVGSSSGKSFKVGEFSNDGIQSPKNIAVKLLRSETLTTKRTVTGIEKAFPTWQLMMKNIYYLGSSPLTRNDFRFEIQYRSDNTGIPSNTLQDAQTPNVATKPLLQILNLDQLDQSQFQSPDGFFDYIENITVNSPKGYIIFPEPEPFGNHLETVLTNASDKKFVFNELYLNTKSNVENSYQNKNKFLLTGYFKTENAGGIPLGAFNVPRGSVKVTAGGRQLVEGVDFVVDYFQGRVQILDPGLQASGVPIQVSTENNAVFNQQKKTFMGIDVEHRFSENLVVGGTILNINERPLTPKVNFGAEPINNTMFGLNVDYSTEMPLFTKWANKLPFVDTDVPSNLSVRADMAYLLPGTPSGIDVTGAATSYIDDFEASQIPISLLSPLQWFTASTPKYFPNFNGDKNDLSYNYKRAKLSWYNIDQIFYGIGQNTENINADELSRAETRQINYTELFPNQELDITQNALIRTLDLAYFPNERGPYNFDPTAIINNDDVTLPNPETRWAGIMRPLTASTSNFNKANVEYIEFWIMDPYQNYSITQKEGLPQGVNPQNIANQGDLFINLGNISEDILKDNRKMYENGLPADGNKINGTNVSKTNWGYVPKNPSILYAFSDDGTARSKQDIGLDGLNDEDEKNLFPTKFKNLSDPAGDNFQFFRGKGLDAISASILTRYKNYNNTEGNSPTANQSTEAFPTSSTSYPDVEDINKDQTMNTVESYFQYKISLKSTDLVKGKNFIVDEKENTVTLKNGATQTTKWYQFRVPVRSGTPINSISDFNSIRFIRMFVTNFKVPVVLRFGELNLVRGDWRRYTKTLDPTVSPDQNLTPQELQKFEVGVVNIEQNEGKYVLPPGIVRERLQGSTTVQQQNEQSVSLKIVDLPQNKVRAIYKNISADLRRYKNLKMFIHAETLQNNSVSDDELIGIIRLGSDLNDNFYQIEVPLKISPNGSTSPISVWPEANNLNVALESLGKVKLERDGLGLPINQIYTSTTANNPTQTVIRIKGNPTLAQLKTVVLGVKNTAGIDKSAEIWFNELRSAGFDNKGGWAAIVNADANFADVGNLSLTGKMQTIGFGNIQDRVQQRAIDETKQYDVSTSLNLGKMMPKKWAIQLPMNYSFGEEFKDPKYDPLYQDVTFKDAKEVNPNSKFAGEYTKRKSISFINVKKNRNPDTKKKARFYDIENVSVSYSYNEEFHRDYNVQRYINQNVNALASYNYSFTPWYFEPFKNSKTFSKKYWQFIKDINFNPIPKTFAINSRINRNYNEQQSRNLIQGLSPQPKLTQRRFLFDWDYTIGFDLTKSLQLNFNATNSYIYDNLGANEDLQIFDKFFAIGRPDHYHQKLNATYKIPINKLPFLGFVSADYGYTSDYDWKASSQSALVQNSLGNLIQNTNTHNVNTTLNLTKFYKSINLKKVFTPKKKGNKNPNLGLPRVPNARNTNVKKSTKQKILDGVYNVLTSVKSIKASYTENNGQLLPGYKPTFGLLGLSNGGPTLGFAFGSQVDIRNKAIENSWLITRNLNDNYINKTYSRTHYNKLDYNVSVKPFKDLSIDLLGNRIKTRNLSQQLDIISGKNTYEDLPIFETGNFSSSYSMIATVFSNSDALFNTFKANRNAISNRLARENNTSSSGFGANSQQVLLPAFVAAYSAKGTNSVKTGLFRNIPIPNWTLRYNGLMNYNWFKKKFSSFSITHGYKSSYTIAGFTNNLEYNQSAPFANKNISGNYEPELLVSTASLMDEFSPLIGVDLKMRNSFSLKGQIRKDRTLTLNFNNSTLTDVKGTEYVIGLGYVIKNVKMSTRFTGKKINLKGDINLRADFSLRDNLTLIRSIDEDNNQISGGQKLFSIKFIADYILNSNLTASFYYNHQTSRYAISTTFPRQSINAGFNFTYNLGN